MLATRSKRILSKDDVAEIVLLLKEPGVRIKDVAFQFSVSERAIRYHLQTYHDMTLDIDYEKQDTCSHSRIYFHCHDCKLSLSENDPLKIIEHMHRHLEAFPIRKLIEMKV